MRASATARLVRARIRQAEALRLRATGMDYEAIASRLGYANRSSAYRAVKKGMDATRDRAALVFRLLLFAEFEQWFQAMLAGSAFDLPTALTEDRIIQAEFACWYERRWAS